MDYELIINIKVDKMRAPIRAYPKKEGPELRPLAWTSRSSFIERFCFPKSNHALLSFM